MNVRDMASQVVGAVLDDLYQGRRDGDGRPDPVAVVAVVDGRPDPVVVVAVVAMQLNQAALVHQIARLAAELVVWFAPDMGSRRRWAKIVVAAIRERLDAQDVAEAK